MTRRPRLLGGALFALLCATVNSCDLDRNGPTHRRPVPVSLSPHFASVAPQTTAPISLIRLTAREQSTNDVVGSSENTVTPTDATWNVGVDIDLGSRSSITVLVAIELINPGEGGSETVEWSAIAGPIEVQAGKTSAVTDVTLGRGPLGNATITAVTIGESPSLVGLADSLTLTATAVGATGQAVIYWTSLNDAVATVDATGKVRGVAVGTASIVATAGTKADTASLTVVGGPASVAIAPKPLTLAGIGAAASLTATVKNAVGGIIPDAQVAWTSRDGGVALVSPAGVVTAVALGTTRVVATAMGADGVADSVDVTVTAGSAASFTISAGNDQTATVGTAVEVAPAVIIRDVNSNPVPNAVVTFAVASGGGSITDPATITTDASGIAAIGSWTLGTTAGTNTLTATASGFTPLTFTATANPGAASALLAESGSGQSGVSGTVLGAPLVAKVTDNFGNGVPDVVVTFTPSGGGLVGTPSATTDADGHAQTTWTPGTVGMSQQVTASADGLTPVTFTATVTLPNPAVGLSLDGVDKVSQGRSATLRVTLNRVAPAGGAVVTLVSANPNVLTIASPSTVSIAGGETTGTITVNGLAEGTSTVTGTATGYDAGTLPVGVEIRSITLPPTFTVPFGGSASLPITLVRPAPAGGTLVTLTTSNPEAVGLATTTVTVPAGAVAVNATLHGVLPGQSTVVASNPNYDPDTTTATSAATLLFAPQSVSLNESFGITARISLTSSGTAIAAPAPGVTVTLTSQSPTCAAAPATVTIPTGLVDVAVPVTYGGSAQTPCNNVRIIATAANITADTLTANVAAIPAVTLGAATIGTGLQRVIGGNLGASNHGGVTVHVVSADPSRILLAPNATTAGSGAIDLPVAAGTSGFSFVAQALETETGTTSITATAPGFTSGAAVVTTVVPALDVSGLPTSRTTFSNDVPFTVRIGTPNTFGGLSELQALRIGATPAVFTVTTSQVSVGSLVSLDSIAGAQVVRIQPGSNASPGNVSQGGVALRAVSAGTTVVTASNENFTTITAGTVTVNVSAPPVNIGAATVGAGLQQVVGGSLGASGHNGVVVHLTSADPSRLLISAAADVAGTPEADVVVTAGGTSFAYYVSGVEGTTGTAAMTATATGFTDGSATINVLTPALDLSGPSTSLTTLTPNQAFTVRVGTPTGTSGLNQLQTVRAGAPPLTATITSSVPAVAQLVTTAAPGAGTVTVQIPAGAASSPSSRAAGGVEIDPLTGGSTVVSATIPGFTTTTNGSKTVNVVASTINLGTASVGAGLQRAASGSLSSSGHGGVTVHLVSSDPSVLLVSPNATTAGTPSIDIPVAAGATSFSYYLQGVEAVTGTPTLTASTSGFTNDVVTVTVVTPALDISGLTNLTTLSPDDPYVVRVGIPFANNASLQELQSVRAGSSGYTVTATSSVPTVGRLTTSSGSGATATARIEAGSSSTPGSVATGGMALDPLANGSTRVTASIPGFITTTTGTVLVNVTAPTMSVSSATVGAGLMRAVGASLGASNHGGVTVHLTSSQPSTLLLSANDQTAGAASVDIPVASGATSFSFFVHGVEGATGTATVVGRANGFSDGSGTMTVVQPAIDVTGLAANQTTIGPDDPFTIRVGIASGGGLGELQTVRAGASPINITIATSLATAGQLKTSSTTGAGVSLTIGPRSNSTPTTVASGGVAFDPIGAGTTVVSATSPGFTTTTNGTVTVAVTAPEFTVSDATLGAGLQDQVTVSIPTNSSGAFMVHLASSDPSRLLLSPDATTAGAAAIDIPMTATATSFSYFVQALDGATGTATVTLTAPAFATGTQTVTMLAPSVEITGLSTTLPAASADDPFVVRVGYATPGATSLSRVQAIRVGGATRTITVTSSNAAAGVMKTTDVPSGAGSVTLSLSAGQSATPASVATGGVAFDPLATGTTTAGASIPGFTSVGLASGQTISITP